jgi:hypothetical protein
MIKVVKNMKCPKCQMTINDNSVFCIHCGAQFRNQNAVTYNETPVNNTQQEQPPARVIICLVLSLINMVAIAPTVFSFSIVWLILGAMIDTSSFLIGLLLFGVYFVGSISFVVYSAKEMSKYDKKKK